jgi:hypothetical protein
MTKIVLFLIMLLVYSSNISAQQTYFSDVFPLAIDTCWIYSFRTVNGIPALQSSTVDEGTIFYKIVTSVIFPDSIEWFFSAKRDFIRTIHPPSHLPPIVEEHHDTLYFSILEVLEGNHLLHLKENDYNSAFPFFYNAPDSEQFFRYVETDTSGQKILQLIPKPGYPPFTVTYTLKKDKGILKTVGYMYSSGGWSVNNVFELVDEVTSSKNVEPEIINYKLSQNYPNPFNPSTIISYQIPTAGNITLKVYDVLGNEVATLVNEYKPAGNYEVEFKSTVGSHQLANGVYFYQLKAGDYAQTKKMILLK